MKQFFTIIAALVLTATTFGQVGINNENPDGSAALDISSTTGGLLVPRMTNVQRQAIPNPAAGLQVFVTDFDGGSFMFYDGTEWGTLSFTKKRPDAPTLALYTSATSGNAEATVSFSAPSSDGGSAITSYTATSSPGGITGTTTSSGSGSIIVTGLTNATAYTFTVTATNAIGTSAASGASNSVTPSSLVIGDFYGGGVIFYIFRGENSFGYVAGETHGLIAAVEDQGSSIPWFNNGSYVYTGETWTDIGKGSFNTDRIIAVQGATETSYAAGLARAYRGGGYTDWFLPSKDELNQMYINKTTLEAVSGFSPFSNVYWSSSEDNSDRAWGQYFYFGDQGPFSKHFADNVRAVRAF